MEVGLDGEVVGETRQGLTEPQTWSVGHTILVATQPPGFIDARLPELASGPAASLLPASVHLSA